ncbi:flagellar motor protein MotB [Sphingomonas donggukensis]|uniref:Flagellar motor protein MotB n=1 Tax=Sphingomonas donggukensis TaxID=2949093 RepID=A0ABY4TWL3_9SPHN|nr:flagellar motor protein MotB [Sphingomonas donggukensis]URW75544.1 flagellar motor protein MotB [Sphingomonas donggukensis]
MTDLDILADEPRRAIWLVTLADVMLLLVGFFVFLEANRSLDGQQIAAGLREGFGVAAPAPMAVDATIVAGFARASAVVPANDTLAWARAATRDPRTIIRVTGGTDGSARDVDPATGSPAILAADRARAVATQLARAVPPARLAIDTRPGAGRSVQLNLAFAGEYP